MNLEMNLDFNVKNYETTDEILQCLFYFIAENKVISFLYSISFIGNCFNRVATKVNEDFLGFKVSF